MNDKIQNNERGNSNKRMISIILLWYICLYASNGCLHLIPYVSVFLLWFCHWSLFHSVSLWLFSVRNVNQPRFDIWTQLDRFAWRRFLFGAAFFHIIPCVKYLFLLLFPSLYWVPWIKMANRTNVNRNWLL